MRTKYSTKHTIDQNKQTRAMEDDVKTKRKTKRPRPSLSAMLGNFYKHEVMPRQRDKAGTQLRVINRVIVPILESIEEIDDRFRTGLRLLTQSSTDGTVSPQQSSTSLRHTSTGARLSSSTASTNFDNQPPVNRLIGMNTNNSYEFDLLVAMERLFVNVKSSVDDCGNDRTRPTLKSSTQEDQAVTYIDSICCNNPYTPVLNGFGYVAVNNEHILVQDLISDLNDSVDNIGRGLESEAYLCPHQLLEKFNELISEAVELLDGKCYWERDPTVFEVDVSQQGSGVRLKIVLAGETFTVELLPALLLHSWTDSMNSWYKQHSNNKWLSSRRIGMVGEDLYLTCDATAKAADERLWKVCYEKSERTLLEYADSDQVDGCRYKAYSILETLLEDNAADFAPMTPQILRNIFIEECIRYPHDEDWCCDKLGRSFVDLFLQVIKCIKTCECTHVFTQRNLLKRAGTKADLKQISAHLKAILQDIVNHPDKSAFLAMNY